MSRLPRLRALFGSPRFALRLPGGQPIRIERVRIKKAKPAARRYLNAVIGTSIALQLVYWMIPTIEFKREKGDRNAQDPTATTAENHDRNDANRDQDDDDGGDDDDHDHDHVRPGERFIGLPLTTQKHPPEPYAPGDPAMKEFAKIHNSKARRRHIGDLLADHARRAALRSQVLTAKWGTDIDIHRYSLDFDYPRAAPPEYTRLGILITDHEIALARMQCDPLLAQRLQRIMWPKPLAMGLWSFGTATAKQTARDVAAYFGFSSDAPGSIQDRPPPPAPQRPGAQRAIEQIGQGASRRPEEVHNSGAVPSSAATPPTTASADQGNKAMGMTGKAGAGLGQRSGGKETSEQEKPRVQDALIPVVSSTQQPWKDFTEAYNRETRFLRPYPARGSLLVTGTVELETPRVIILVDARGWYDPKTRIFDPQNTRLQVRRVRYRS